MGLVKLVASFADWIWGFGLDLIHYRWIGFGLDCSKKGLDWLKKFGLDFLILPTSAQNATK